MHQIHVCFKEQSRVVASLPLASLSVWIPDAVSLLTFTLNEQHLKLAVGYPLESWVAADFPCPIIVYSEKREILSLRKPFYSSSLLYQYYKLNYFNGFQTSLKAHLCSIMVQYFFLYWIRKDSTHVAHYWSKACGQQWFLNKHWIGKEVGASLSQEPGGRCRNWSQGRGWGLGSAWTEVKK